MVRWIVESSLRYRFIVLSLAVLVMIVGIAQLHRMPVDVFPEFEPPFVEVQTEALGLSADEVESLITLNLEEFLSGTPWLKTIRSESVPGLSSIHLIFNPGTDLMRARQLVQESLSRAHTMPNVSKPPVMLQPMSSTKRAMMVGMSSKELTPIQLSVLAQWTIKPRLLGVPGVANVVIWGQKHRQLQVQVNPKILQKEGLTQDQIIRTTGDALWVSSLSFLNASVPGTGGWIDTPNQRLGIRHTLPISTPDQLARVPVYGSSKLLGDVATVVEGHPPLIGDALLDDGPGLILVIEKLPGANTLEVTHGVEEALAALKLGLPGLEFDTSIFRLASFIEMAMTNLTLGVIISILFVAAVLWGFLFHFRSAMISLVSIPLSLMVAVLVLYLMNTTINIMVLAGFGIAIGIIVDDAIIDIENILRRLRSQKRYRSIFQVIVEASMEVRNPIIYATLIIVLAVVPIFFLEGVSGAFFRPLVLSYSLALVASMLTALTVTPALVLMFIGEKSTENPQSPVVTRLQNHYYSFLERIIKSPNIAFFGFGFLLIIGLVIYPFLGHSFLPTFKERDILIDMEGPPGTSQPEMSRILNRVSSELKKLSGVRKVGVQIGRAITGDQVVGINSSKIWASIDPDADYEKTVESIRDVVAAYPGFDRDVNTYLSERIKDALSGTSESIVVRMYGPERELLRKKAEEVREALENIEGLVDLQVEGQVDEPHIEVKVDIARARPHGIKPGDVRRAAATIFAGIQAGDLFEEQKVFDVIVWGDQASRNSITDIKNLLIDKPGGGYVHLGEVADVEIVSAPTVINHEAISPRIDIVANVRGRDIGSVTREVQERLNTIDFPLEYHPELLGEYAERLEAQNRLLMISLGSAIGIYLLLQACFGSWKLASLSFLALPMALVGGLIGVFLNGSIISLGSLVGFLTVFGLAARHGIMLIHHYQHLEHVEGLPFGKELIMRGSSERITPIMMTAATTGVALLPFVFLGKIAGLEIEHPMAVVILGGVVTSTLLNIFLIPPLYLLFGSDTQQRTDEEF